MGFVRWGGCVLCESALCISELCECVNSEVRARIAQRKRTDRRAHRGKQLRFSQHAYSSLFLCVWKVSVCSLKVARLLFLRVLLILLVLNADTRVGRQPDKSC